MPRLPRLPYENAIYHIVTRGDGRRRLFNDDGDDAKHRRRVRRSAVITVDDVLSATADEYGVTPDEYCGFRSGAGGRDVAAYLCRRYTTATLAELSERFGLGHPDSSSDLVKRAKRNSESNREVRRKMKQIEKKLGLKPESRD